MAAVASSSQTVAGQGAGKAGLSSSLVAGIGGGSLGLLLVMVAAAYFILRRGRSNPLAKIVDKSSPKVQPEGVPTDRDQSSEGIYKVLPEGVPVHVHDDVFKIHPEGLPSRQMQKDDRIRKVSPAEVFVQGLIEVEGEEDEEEEEEEGEDMVVAREAEVVGEEMGYTAHSIVDVRSFDAKDVFSIDLSDSDSSDSDEEDRDTSQPSESKLGRALRL